MPIHLDPRVSRTDSALVADVQSHPAEGVSGSIGNHSVTFRPTTRLESLANSLRDVFSFGLYSRLRGNPSQWKKLRAGLLHDAQQGNSRVSEVALKRLFLTYSDSSKLTAAKLNNILSDYERAKNDPNWQPQLIPNFTDASQHPVARAARSLHQLTRKLTAQEQELKDVAAAREAEYAQAGQEFEGYLGTGTRGGVTNRYRGAGRDSERPAVLEELGNGVYAAKAMQHILRPGRTLQSDDLSYYMAALQRVAKSANAYVPKDNPEDRSHYHFGYKMANWPTQPVGEVFAEAKNLYRDHMRSIGGDKGLYAIPLVLHGKGALENHVILVAIDADRKQINVLDSKGYSLESIESSYSNAAGLKQELESLGKSFFGQGWQAQKNILQLNIPKQQGGNDCGAFVCDFTKQLLEGKSVGDIERTFDAKQRSELRMQAAQTIKEGFLDGLDEDISFLREAAQANEDMPSFLQAYIPFSEGLQKENSAILKGSAARSSPRAAPPAVGRTDSPQNNPALYSVDAPFGTGGIVRGHYVQRQYGECCFAHALASYFKKPVFASREEFLDYRNVSYDNVYEGFLEPESIAHGKQEELSDVEPVNDVLTRLQNDQSKNVALSMAPWVSGLFRTTDPGKAVELDSVRLKAKVDATFSYLAEQSDSKRFIVRNGGAAGHFQTLVYEPERNPQAPWTLLNSSSNQAENSLLPQVKSSKSPAELLNAHTTRGLVLGVWTQSNNPASNLGWQDLMGFALPKPAQDSEYEVLN